MSEESILDHGYIAEEHAPDPMMSHGDPTAPGKVGIWLFLASEVMFFIGVLGTYIVLRSGQPELFARHAAILNKTLGGANTLVLLLSSATMYFAVESAHKGQRNRVIGGLLVTLLCAGAFMCVKYVEYRDKFTHHTIVTRESNSGPVYVYEGHVHADESGQRVLHGFRAPVPENFNINLISEGDVHHLSGQQAAEEFTLPATISQDITYGPWKNVFFASYFTTTGVHGIHVLGGMIALAILLVHSLRGKVMPAHTEYVGLYWHFVDLVWIFLFPLLYLI